MGPSLEREQHGNEWEEISVRDGVRSWWGDGATRGGRTVKSMAIVWKFNE